MATLGLLGVHKVGLAEALSDFRQRFGGLPGFKPAEYKNFKEAIEIVAAGGMASEDLLRIAIDSGIVILK